MREKVVGGGAEKKGRVDRQGLLRPVLACLFERSIIETIIVGQKKKK